MADERKTKKQKLEEEKKAKEPHKLEGYSYRVDSTWLTRLFISRSLCESDQQKVELISLQTKKAGTNKIEHHYEKEKGREWDLWYGKALAPVNLSKSLRRMLCGSEYFEVDMSACYPTIALYLCEKYEIDAPSLLTWYSERKAFVDQCISEDHSLTAERIKRQTAIIMTGCKPFAQSQSHSLIAFHKALHIELIQLLTKLTVSGEYLIQYTHASLTSIESSFLPAVFRTFQAQLVECIMKYAREKSFTLGGINSDAFMFSCTEFPTLESRQTLCSDLMSVCTVEHHIPMRFAVKSLDVTSDDIALIYGPTRSINTHLITDMDKYDAALEFTFYNHCRTVQGDVYAPMVDKPGVYTKCDNVEFIRLKSLGSTPITRTKSIKKDYISSTDSTYFPIKSAFDDHLVAFRNGIFDLNTMTTRLFSASDLCRKYYDVDYTDDLIDAPTPAWDKLLNHQWKDEPEVKKMLEVMFGRTFFPLNQDRWDKMTLIRGAASTGKSIMIEVLETMHAPGTTGSISAHSSKQFSLQNLYDKSIIVCSELPSDICSVLPADKFKKMVIGELMDIQVKGKDDVTCKWKGHLVWASNYVPDYDDKQGSITRRMIIFELPYDVEEKEKDLTLQNRIISTELPQLFLRFIHKYKQHVQFLAGSSVDSHLPEFLSSTLTEVKMSTNLLKSFIEDGSHRVTVMRDDDQFTLFSEFVSSYNNYCKYQMHSPIQDRITVKDLLKHGFTVKKVRKCKKCEACPATSSSCNNKYGEHGEHYEGGKHRTIVNAIMGMKLIKRDSHVYVAGTTGQFGSAV